MGFFDELSSKSALNSKINRLNASIKQNYEELGTRYYNLYKENPDPKFKELIDEITSAYAQIKETEVELAYLRGVVFCPNCHSECGIDLKFCVKCGAKLVKPVQYQQPIAPAQPVAPAQPQQTAAPVTPTAPAVPETPAPAVTEEAPVAQPAPQPEQPVAADPQAEFKFCTQCGNKVSVNAAFCTNCGKSLK